MPLNVEAHGTEIQGLYQKSYFGHLANKCRNFHVANTSNIVDFPFLILNEKLGRVSQELLHVKVHHITTLNVDKCHYVKIVRPTTNDPSISKK